MKSWYCKPGQSSHCIPHPTTTTAAPTTTTAPTTVPTVSTTTMEPQTPTSTVPDSSTTTFDIGTPATLVCTEDMACWDCHTMGNHVCGSPSVTAAVVATTHQLPVTGASGALGGIGAGLVCVGVVCAAIARRWTR